MGRPSILVLVLGPVLGSILALVACGPSTASDDEGDDSTGGASTGAATSTTVAMPDTTDDECEDDASQTFDIPWSQIDCFPDQPVMEVFSCEEYTQPCNPAVVRFDGIGSPIIDDAESVRCVLGVLQRRDPAYVIIRQEQPDGTIHEDHVFVAMRPHAMVQRRTETVSQQAWNPVFANRIQPPSFFDDCVDSDTPITLWGCLAEWWDECYERNLECVDPEAPPDPSGC